MAARPPIERHQRDLRERHLSVVAVGRVGDGLDEHGHAAGRGHGLDALGLRNFLLGINVHREEDDIWQEGEGEGKRFVGKEIKKV